MLPLALLLLFNNKPKPGLRVTVLDVGQGLAVVVETDQRNLLYDSGAQFSAAFSAGSGIVAPFLWQRGWSSIDTALISHEDGDHSGGFAALQQVLPIRQIITRPGVNYSEVVLQGQNVEICNAGAELRWGEVLFEILSPTSEVDSVTAREGNNSSCVLRIRWRDIQLLLPGDIESATEYQLLDSGRLEGLQLDLLVAPHHGSKTSSTAKFVQQLAPKHVVFSAGYQHQFGHPHSSVTKRYSAVGSRVWNTAEQGAITFEWLPSGEPPEKRAGELAGELKITTARSQTRRWWR